MCWKETYRLKRSSNRNTLELLKCYTYKIAAEQKARTTYDNILRYCDDPDVRDPIKFLRQREVVHYQRFGETKLTNYIQ